MLIILKRKGAGSCEIESLCSLFHYDEMLVLGDRTSLADFNLVPYLDGIARVVHEVLFGLGLVLLVLGVLHITRDDHRDSVLHGAFDDDALKCLPLLRFFSHTIECPPYFVFDVSAIRRLESSVMTRAISRRSVRPSRTLRRRLPSPSKRDTRSASRLSAIIFCKLSTVSFSNSFAIVSFNESQCAPSLEALYQPCGALRERLLRIRRQLQIVRDRDAPPSHSLLHRPFRSPCPLPQPSA